MQPSLLFLNISAMSDLDKRMIGLSESAHVYGICANFSVAPQDGNKIHTGFFKATSKAVLMATSSYPVENTVLKTAFSLHYWANLRNTEDP